MYFAIELIKKFHLFRGKGATPGAPVESLCGRKVIATNVKYRSQPPEGGPMCKKCERIQSKRR